MNSAQSRTAITHALEDVAENCRQNRALVLTESDLKCQVYIALSRVPEFGEMRNTNDHDIRGPALHTETKFFNQAGLLSQAPDLVITDPQRLSIVRRLDGELLPSKGFHFDGSAVLIELKFLKKEREPIVTDLSKIQDDIKKGDTLNRRGDLDFHLIVAVFDRFTRGRVKVENLFQQHSGQANLTCLYFGGGPSLRLY